MSARAHHFRVGVFVLAGIALIVAAIVAFGVGALGPEELFWAETYMDESVQGLEVGSPVKLQGVEVGRVEMITFADAIYDLKPEHVLHGRHVLIRMALFREAMVSTSEEDYAELGERMVSAGLRVRLASQGFTGVRYIEAEMLDPDRYPPMELEWEPEVLYVPSAQGVLSEIVDSIDALTRRIENIPFEELSSEAGKLVETLHKGVEDVDLATLSQKAVLLLDDLHEAAGSDLGQMVGKFDQFIDRMNTIVGDIEVAEAMANLNETSESLREATAGLPRTIERLDRAIETIDILLSGEGDTLRVTLHDLRDAIQNLKEFTDTAKRYPAAVLFGKSPPPADPGEAAQDRKRQR